MGIRVCIDIGGTFTDLAVVNDKEGKLSLFKTSTTPDDYARAVIEGLSMAAEFYGMPMDQFLKLCSSRNGGAINYGTTLATNAVLQKKVAKVGLICTKGHRDILTFREGGKEDPFNWDIDYPDPYVPRYLTLPVTERIDAQGEIVTPLDENEAREAIRQFKRYGVEVIAVALLWCIVNPLHEKNIGELIEEEWPGCPFFLSHLINPVIREYRRTISTVINASLMPVVGPAIRGFDERLKELGYEGNLSLISAFGGIMSLQDITEKPIYCIDSGPTGGPVAGLLYARRELNRNDVITCDMGGTSFDVSRVTGGEIRTTIEAKVGFDYLGVRKVDTKSIGAGGGSIAWVDAGGLLRVGPESAGAQPGPACYRRGGTRPTVTDANLVLGYLNPQFLLGGKMKLEKKLATEVIEKHIAGPLGISSLEAAFSIWNTVCVNMTDAIRTITSWEGIDPREYVFVSGGGAAGAHIIPMMIDMGVRQLIIPKAAGALSAVGGLAADMVADFQRNYECNTGHFEFERVNKILSLREKEGTSFLESNGVKPENRRLEFSVDARYYSQPWELTIPLRVRMFKGESDVIQFVKDFHRMHERMRGSREEGQLVECSNWRVKAVGKTKEFKFYKVETGQRIPPKFALIGKRMVYFKELGGMVETKVFDGDKLKAGNRITAPAIIEEMATTIVVFPGSEITVTNLGNYLVKLHSASSSRSK
ncbi:MAG: hydantoinase/oxoprolinase family protein [Thermodesulfobacteriota bacterium]